MLKRIHPLTSIAVLLMGVAIAVFLSGYAPICLVLLALAYVLVGLEFKQYTSDYQFVMLTAVCTAMGITHDLTYHDWPWMTVILSIAAFATIVRQKYMQRFTYVDLLWLDSGLALAAAGGFLLTLQGAFSDPFRWSVPLLPITGAVGLTLSYVQDGLRIKRQVKGGYRIQVGREAPEIALPDEDGTIVRLSDYRGKHPVLLVFVRGDWCPGCHMMLRTYERNRQAFLSKDIHVLGIGPDDVSVNKAMVRRIGVGFRMLSDNEQRTASVFGVVYNNPALEVAVDYAQGIPLPASFLVDINGIVRYVSRPDRVGEFLDPSMIFGVLDTLPDPAPAWS